MNFDHFPCEFFLKLENQDFLIGRITINKLSTSYTAEIDLVQKESRKIHKHITILYNEQDPREALENAVQRVSDYFRETPLH